MGACAGVQAAEQPKHPPEIEALADRARSLPPEFAADALIRIAESGKVADRNWKRGLLEDAFTFAAGAQQPYKRRAAVGGGTDARSGFTVRAFTQDLDACSLQCRAVNAMLALDAGKARELFNEIPPPRIPRLECEDALVYDVSAFYETLTKIVNTTFTAKELREEEHVAFAVRFLAGISSPAQVAPAAKMLAGLHVNPAQLEALTQSFSGALKGLSGDDRSFSWTVGPDSPLGSAIALLAETLKRQGISNYALLEGYRGYLANHFSGNRCELLLSSSSLITPGGTPPNPGFPEAATFFNDKLRAESFPPDIALAALTPDDLKPAKTEGGMKREAGWDSQEMTGLVTKYRRLVFGEGGQPYSPEQKDGVEWRSQLDDYMGALASWTGNQSGDAADYFRQKCLLYTNLIGLVPNGRERDSVLRSLLAFLKQNSFQNENRIEWFYAVNSLLARVATDPRGLAQLAAEMRECDDPVISLYASLEGLIPRSLQQVVWML